MELKLTMGYINDSRQTYYLTKKNYPNRIETMNISKAKKLLGIEEALFTAQELKKAFRKQSLTHHPDVGGTKTNFENIVKAFKALEGHCSNSSETQLKTVNGTLLSKLGRGLPITTSVKPCNRCDSKGYIEYRDWTTINIECPTCAGTGVFSYPCNNCNGKGHFINHQTGKVLGNCSKCGGDGRFYPPYKAYGLYDFFYIKTVFQNGKQIKAKQCTHCFGDGEVPSKKETETTKYLECSECTGIGEIEIFNPVIPRGLFQEV